MSSSNNSKEAYEKALDRTVYAVRSGSFMYGLDTPQSDEDFLGTYVDSPEDTLGLSEYAGVRYGDDLVLKRLDEFVRHLENGSHFWVEPLFAPPDAVSVNHPSFRAFLDHKRSFLTLALVDKSLGFIKGMVRRGQDEADAMPRAQKQIAHAVRVSYLTLRLLETGEFLVRDVENRAEILGIKEGTVPLADGLARADSMMSQLEALRESCALPLVVGRDLLNHLVTETTLQYWTARGEL
ncbi:MAG: nucleotidyltransferase domain-containing protein [Armatimonadetes bacterium]|nr:nucleotidyltransferase domain-containing protein [Armatimonadota bacterium]